MKKLTPVFLFLILALGFLSTFSTAAMADDDPPGRVARLNYIQGSISFQPAGETDWVQANPNRPLTTGDNLWTDRNSRGELHINSTAIRVSSETGVSFLNLDDRNVQIQLAQGSLNVHVRRLDGGDNFEIDTPNLAFTLHRPGEYRIDVDPDASATFIVVREGEGEATGGGSSFHLDTGEQARISGTDSLTFDEADAGRPDEFDQWCSSRDDREEHAESARYVSRDVNGYEDLDDYGEWRSVPDYGTVWFPSHVAVGWAPYRFGHWVFIQPWGWTWVEDEPWGFAPFHYGRWAVVGGGWCWVPGPVVVRPVYAPALVAFVGGSHFSLSLSIGGGGGVAWFPLGPREVYVPSYRASQRYVQNVNVTNTTVNVVNVTNVYNTVNNNVTNNVNVNKITYMHQNNVNAVTAVSHDTFVNARPVGTAAVHVNADQLRGAEIQRGTSFTPVQKSVVGAGTPATVRPPEAVMKRQVVVRETPPAPRTPFVKSQPTQSFQPGRTPVQQGQSPVQQPPVQQPQVKQQPQFPQRGQPQQPQVQQHEPQQPQSQPQVQQRQPQNPQPQQSRPQMDTSRKAPEQQNPTVKFAPPVRATEETYHPHPFEKPQSAPAPKNVQPQEAKPAPAQERPQERPQPRGPEPSKGGGGEQERNKQR